MAYATNSSGNYSGTIIVSPIRPANPSSTIATVFSNEIKGSHHTYETITERDAVIESRRDWGMLCTIYNDPTPSNNKTYILRYGFTSTTLLDNSNWIEFVTTGANFVPTGGEWINSVQIVSATPSILTDGYRYLVDAGGIGDFLGQDGKIAQYNLVALTFSFVEPTDGTTLRNDSEPNVVYKYQGSFSSGSWVKEYLNQVRYLTAYSIDGMSYSATSSQTPLTSYSDSVYYVNFNMTSSGTVSLNIDSIGLVDIKKLENNTLSFIGTNEIIPNVQYQLLYNSGIFQTVLPASTTTTIGPAEDGDYTDGLFVDFTTSTPIGVAIDRFNEALRILFGLPGTSSTGSPVVPFAGPTLSSWSATGSFVNGALSFDNSDFGFISATGSPYGAVQKGETFSNLDTTPYRLGIRSKVLQPITGTAYYGDISGVFNSNVPATTGYSANSFNYGSSGTFSLILNGVTISSVGLSTLSSIDTTSGGATSGLVFSAATTTGINLPELINRTGSYLIKKDNPNIVEGYNYFVARHDTDSNSYILSQFEFVADGSTSSVNPVTRVVSSVTSPSKKFISGIEYYKDPMNFVYTLTLSNVLSNTFNQSPSALTFKDVSTQVSSVTNSVTGTLTNNAAVTSPVGLPTNQVFYVVNNQFFTQSILPPPGFVPSTPLSYNVTYSIATSRRRINDSIGFAVDLLKTVQGTFSGATSLGTSVPVNNWFIDTVPAESTSMIEYFSDEVYRKRNGSNKYNSFLLISDVNVLWNSSGSLIADTNNWNGLQVINGTLVYPKFDFNSVGSSQTNPNFGIPSRNYSTSNTLLTGFGTSSTSSLTNYRTYTRYFNQGVASRVTWRISIDFVGTTFVNSNLPLIGNTPVWIEVKIGPQTGWLDLTKPYISSRNSNGDGCYTRYNLLGNTLNITFTPGVNSNFFLFRVTANPDWTGHIRRITVT